MASEVFAATQPEVVQIREKGGGLGVSGWLSVSLLTIFLLLALLPEQIAPYDPVEQDVPNRLQYPSVEHLFGTDELGRDIFSRVVHGAKTSLTTAIIAVLVSLLLGVPIGLVSGYAGGRVDEILSRATDILLAFPGILVAMTIIAITGRNPIMVATAIGIVATPAFVRVTRAIALTIKAHPYVDAVRSAGASDFYIMFLTILPNAFNEIYVQALLIASRAIIIAASLSFLGLGIPPPAPSWGGMLNQSRNYLHQMPWYGVFPGLFIALLVLAFQLLSNSLQQSFRGKK
ncbi:ABC transporter permease [Chloroflexi bacterium TSY]|nr:ABC transporter permease [Chloroflexi bacterium TSY]